MNRLRFCCVLAAWLLFGGASFADTFGSGANSFQIDFVTIGNPGNPPDTNANLFGAVPYAYRIGKYEISEQMIDKANSLGGLGITKDTRGPDYPAASISWFEAARFVNWLNTSTGSVPAYKFDANGNFQLWSPIDPGYNSKNLYRNHSATYFLPSINEWHKAAYYDPVSGVYYQYPTGSNSVPDGIDFSGDPNFDAVFRDGGSNGGPNVVTNVGLPSPYGSFGQGGNAEEWLETADDFVNSGPGQSRILRGGNWIGGSGGLLSSNLIAVSPNFEGDAFGFRVASTVPEPRTFMQLGTVLIAMLTRRHLGRGKLTDSRTSSHSP